MKLKMAIHKLLAYLWDPVLPFFISLLYYPDDGPLVELKHILVKIF
jgi:hypothetical protein